jgi:ABC-type transport system involved in multi-copper enzyme maturation permease subunit
MIKFIWLKEIKAEFYTWKGTVWLLIASLMLSITSYLLLTDKELSLLDQTELLWLLSKIIIGVGLLIITIDASSVLTIEFETDTAEDLFLAPISLYEILAGKILFIVTLWLLVFLVSVPYILVTSAGSHLAGAFLGYVFLFGTLAVLGLAMFVIGLSLLFRSGKNTSTTALIILLALVVPALFSTSLKTNSIAEFFGRINPIDNIFAALDNILVDYQIRLSQNFQFIFPILAFCALAFMVLMACARRFKKKGIVKNE